MRETFKVVENLEGFFCLLHSNRVELTGVIALPAMDTAILINDMRFFAFSADAVDRTTPGAQRTADTFFRIDDIRQQGGTDFRRALLVVNMGFIFIPEIFQRTQHRVRGRFA